MTDLRWTNGTSGSSSSAGRARIRESALITYVVAGTVAPMHATDAVPAPGRAA
jgi:hypothetical protein